MPLLRLFIAGLSMIAGSVLIYGQANGIVISAPAAVLHDKPSSPGISGLKPLSTYVIRYELYSRAGTIWRSEAEYRSDETGRVNTAATAPTSGEYTDVHPLAPFWAMRNTGGRSGDSSMFDGDDQTYVNIQVREAGKTLAQHVVRLRNRDIGVSTVELRGPVTGAFYSPPRNGKMPGVIVLGGSEGGISRPAAALIASHGYPSLALGYFGVDKLPNELTRIPVETVDRAVDWLRQQPGVNPDRIVVFGSSKGAELALLAASHNRRIKGVIASAPSSIVFEGIGRGGDTASTWTIGGQEVPFARYVQSDEYTKSRRLIDLYNPTVAAAKPETRIAVENINGPVLLISGKDDQLWPASQMANEISERLAAKRFRHPVKNLIFPMAGHHAGRIPLMPTADSVRLGGTAAEIAKAQVESWREITAFLAAVKARTP